MNWNDIHYFLVLARAGSLSAAARSLGVTHVTVGNRISELEAVRGVRLFHRRQNGCRLTAAGERLFAEGEAVEKACLYFERQMIGLSDVPEGLLTVSVPETTLVDLSNSLAAFMRAYPGITLNVLATSKHLDVNELQADVVLRITDNPPELLVGRRLTEISLYAYGTKQYLAELNSDIDAAQWVVWEPEPGAAMAYGFLHDLNPNAQIAMRTNSNSQLLAMVRENGVLGLLAPKTARLYPELVTAHDRPLVTFGLWMLTHGDLRNAARVRCFMSFMRDRNWSL